MRLSPLLLCATLPLAGVVFAACGGSDATDATTSGGVAAAGASGHSSGGSGGTAAGGSAAGGATGGSSGSSGSGGSSSIFSCSPACTGTDVCSQSRHCIPAGTCELPGDCSAGMTCDSTTKTCAPGGSCGATKVASDKVVANLLLVLDRSCSMTGKVGTSGKSKWQIAVAAIDQLTKTYAGKIRFGLTMFPDKTGDKCEQEPTIPVPVGPSTETAIQTLLDASLKMSDPNFPSDPCVTPIDSGLYQASIDPSTKDPAHPTFVLLLTDGEQSSGCKTHGAAAGATKIITDMATAGVFTFVVGFGGAVNPTQLDAFAVAGGKPTTGATKFYNAADGQSLDKALADIASQTDLGCVFQLTGTPPDPSMLYVFFDGTTDVPRDPTHANGWDYDATKNQVTVYGMDCTSLESGAVKKVDVVYGCDKPPME